MMVSRLDFLAAQGYCSVPDASEGWYPGVLCAPTSRIRDEAHIKIYGAIMADIPSVGNI